MLAALALFAAVTASHSWFLSVPNREEIGPAVRGLEIIPVEIAADRLAPLTLVGAWRLKSDDRRFGGISGLAIDGSDLVAISDSGVVFRFPEALRRGSVVRIDELPGGPGSPGLKRNRDSEALAADPHGRGWWVPFENRNELWLYDRGFARALDRRPIPAAALGKNKGVEGLTKAGSGLLLFPESGSRALRIESDRWRVIAMDDRIRRLGDAAAAGEGAFLVAQRQLTVLGFRNSLAFLRQDGDRLRTLWRKRIPVAWYDNVEAIAVEPSPAGGYRLWMMTDDNLHPRMRTLLLVVEIPEALLRQP